MFCKHHLRHVQRIMMGWAVYAHCVYVFDAVWSVAQPTSATCGLALRLALLTVAVCVCLLLLCCCCSMRCAVCLSRLRVSWRGLEKTHVVVCIVGGLSEELTLKRRIAAGCRCKCSLPVHGLVYGCKALPACPFCVLTCLPGLGQLEYFAMHLAAAAFLHRVVAERRAG